MRALQNITNQQLPSESSPKKYSYNINSFDSLNDSFGITTLDKKESLMESNDKLCDSRWIDQKVPEQPQASINKNTMKFSFNMNYHTSSANELHDRQPNFKREQRRITFQNQEQKSEDEHQHQIGNDKPKLRGMPVGLIKRNCSVKSHQSVQQAPAENLARATSINKPQFKPNCETNMTLPGKKASHIPISKVIEQKEKAIPATIHLSSSGYTAYFVSLFQLLDSNRSGMLRKDNCDVLNIPEELKFIFGSIFTRIKLKRVVCNQRQFLKLCHNCIKDIENEPQLKIYLKKLTLAKKPQEAIQQQNITDRSSKAEKEGNFKEYSEDRHQSHYTPNKSFIDRVNEVSIYHDPRMSKANITKESFDQFNLEKEWYDSAKRQRLSVNKQKQRTIVPMSTQKRSECQRHRNEDYRNKYKGLLEVDLSDPYSQQVQIRKTGKGHASSLKHSVIQTEKATKPVLNRAILPTDSVIREHKRGLDSLNSLNQRMQSYLETSAKHQPLNLSFMGEDSLRFDELVKHI